MMALIKTWLLGITAAALLVALAQALAPPGAVRKIGALIGGLVLLLTILQPILRVDSDTLAQALTEYRAAFSADGAGLAETDADLMKALIAEQSSAYILDKAAALGIACTVQVETQPGENGYPIPCAVTLRGSLSAQERGALTRLIEADFAIPAERQFYETGDVR